MRIKSDVTLYERDGMLYGSYYSHGKRKQRSTGVKADNSKSSEVVARNIVTGWIAEEKVSALMKRPGEKLFRDFAKDFFVWGECQYLNRKLEKDHAISRVWAAERRRHVVNLLLPRFGDIPISDITRPMVERWILSIHRANRTRNMYMYTLREILAEAMAEGVISNNPLQLCEPLGTSGAIKRDTLDWEHELPLLFPSDDAKALKIWSSDRLGRTSAREIYTLMLTMAKTGIRSGEARALRWGDFDGQWLTVQHAVKADGTIGSLKARTSNEGRTVIVEPGTAIALRKWKMESQFPEDDSLIFYGAGPDKPIDKKTILCRWKAGLKKASIPTEGRVLVVHSLRHGYNTRLRRIIPLEQLQLLTGHRSEAMSDLYSHERRKELELALTPFRDAVLRALA
jgi:integrase